jgi:hypothetical protein
MTNRQYKRLRWCPQLCFWAASRSISAATSCRRELLRGDEPPPSPDGDQFPDLVAIAGDGERLPVLEASMISRDLDRTSRCVISGMLQFTAWYPVLLPPGGAT